MNCDTVRHLLYRHADNALLPDDAAATTTHLAACAACRVRLADIARLDEASAATEGEAPSPALRRRLLAYYRTRVAAARPHPMRRRLAVRRAAAAILLVVSSGGTSWWLATRSGPTTPAAPPSLHPGAPSPDAIDSSRMFPLLIGGPFQMVDADGRSVQGYRLQIIQ